MEEAENPHPVISQRIGKQKNQASLEMHTLEAVSGQASDFSAPLSKYQSVSEIVDIFLLVYAPKMCVWRVINIC